MDYVKKVCKDCGQQFEVRTDHLNDYYADYCAQCFFDNVHLYMDGSMELKTEKEKEKDLSYKDELQAPTHRGKHRVKYDITDQRSE